MKKLKKCTNAMTVLLLSIAIIITVMSGFVRFVLTDKNMYLELLEKTGTYSLVKTVLYEKIDNILGSNSTDKLKESIITDEDIKSEADIVITSLINDLISGQATEPQIDTTVYRDRIAEVLESLTGYGSGLKEKSDLTSSNQIYQYNVVPMNLSLNSYGNTIQHNNLIVIDSGKHTDDVIVSNVATREEIEAKGRAMLRERGMTEEQARQKLAEKGMSEEQAWDYLKKNGYLDEEESTVDSTENSSGNNSDDKSDLQNNSTGNSEVSQNRDGAENTGGSDVSQSQDNGEATGKTSESKKIDNIVIPVILDKDKTFDEKMNEISSKLLDYAQSIIDSEVDKLNFSKLAQSAKVKLIFKTTHILYEVFYGCLVIIAVLVLILAIVNKFSVAAIGNYIGKSSLISGIILSLIFGSVYLSKFYKKIELGINKRYFEPMFFATADYFCKILFVISIIIFIVGLIINIFMIKKRVTRR